MPRVACPHCRAKYDIPDRHVGKAVACKKCGEQIVLSPTATLPPTIPVPPKAVVRPVVPTWFWIASGVSVVMAAGVGSLVTALVMGRTQRGNSVAAVGSMLHPAALVPATSSTTREEPPPITDGRVYKSGSDLMADMPAEAFPKYGKKYGIERSKANAWLTKTVRGRLIEWQAMPDSVTVSSGKPFSVKMMLRGLRGVPDEADPVGVWPSFSEPFMLGEQTCQAGFSTSVKAVGLRGGVIVARGDTMAVVFNDCTEAEADTLRKFEGKAVTFRSRIDWASIWDDPLTGRNEKNPLPVLLSVQVISLDGYTLPRR